MDDAERIPIDIGYEVPAVGLEQTDQLTAVREDGTLVIDILAPEPCESEPSTDDEIVVCANGEGGSPRLPTAPPPSSPGPLEKLEEALTAKIGPLEITPFGVRLRF
jgi:hypothetical protein